MQKDPLELWNFAVALYEEEDVKAACLRVQARYGLSISLLLGAIWIGINGFGRFGATDMEMVIRRAMEWHREVIEPIRALRRQLRREPPQGVEEQTHALRHQLVEAELEAERIEMRLLLQDLPDDLPVSPPAERWRDAAINASLLMRKHCPRLEREAEEALVRIILAASPDTPQVLLCQQIRSLWLVG
ncbi:MAG: TIGR02444 family protein [Xanthomonadaceae bacterium]|nr:TIGR02444 family protein [Xanthomonadaceae bacterium]